MSFGNYFERNVLKYLKGARMNNKIIQLVSNVLILVLISVMSKYMFNYTPKFFEEMLLWFILVGTNK